MKPNQRNDLVGHLLRLSGLSSVQELDDLLGQKPEDGRQSPPQSQEPDEQYDLEEQLEEQAENLRLLQSLSRISPPPR